MEKSISPHDRYFRSAMSDLRVAQDFFMHHLPEKVKEHIDLSSLRLCKESFITEQLKLGITDILYSVSSTQGEAYIYLLVEHQSRGDPLMPFRIVKYVCAVMDHHIKKTQSNVLPLVVPLVFYHGLTPYPYSTDIFDLFSENKTLAKEFLFRSFQLIDIGRVSDAEIRRHQWSGIMEFVTKHIFARDIMPYIKELVQQVKIVETEGGHDYIIRTFKYLWLAGAIQNEELFVQAIEEELSSELKGEIMTLAEIYMEKGLQRGMQKEKYETAQKLLLKKMNLKDVAEITGLSREVLIKLQSELAVESE